MYFDKEEKPVASNQTLIYWKEFLVSVLSPNYNKIRVIKYLSGTKLIYSEILGYYNTNPRLINFPFQQVLV